MMCPWREVQGHIIRDGHVTGRRAVELTERAVGLVYFFTRFTSPLPSVVAVSPFAATTRCDPPVAESCQEPDRLPAHLHLLRP